MTMKRKKKNPWRKFMINPPKKDTSQDFDYDYTEELEKRLLAGVGDRCIKPEN